MQLPKLNYQNFIFGYVFPAKWNVESFGVSLKKKKEFSALLIVVQNLYDSLFFHGEIFKNNFVNWINSKEWFIHKSHIATSFCSSQKATVYGFIFKLL